MKNAFQIEVLDTGPHTSCDHYSDEGVHIWGPITVRDSRMILVELAHPIPPDTLGPLLAELLTNSGITRVRLFDDQITVTDQNLTKILLNEFGIDH